MPTRDPAQPQRIRRIAEQLGLDDSNVEPYGWFAGKLSANLHRHLQDRPQGKLIGVTAINPTPFGEGKTVVSIGLAMALARRSKRSLVTLRQPSLAPVFGIKGGGAGGGRSCLLPPDEINFHFTGDLHAIAACNSLAQTFGAACVSALVGGAYGNLWMGIVSALFSIAMLLIAEIVPKSIGLAWTSVLAPQLAWPIQAMVWVVYPLAILCRWLSRTINRHAPGRHRRKKRF